MLVKVGSKQGSNFMGILAVEVNYYCQDYQPLLCNMVCVLFFGSIFFLFSYETVDKFKEYT